MILAHSIISLFNSHEMTQGIKIGKHYQFWKPGTDTSTQKTKNNFSKIQFKQDHTERKLAKHVLWKSPMKEKAVEGKL